MSGDRARSLAGRIGAAYASRRLRSELRRFGTGQRVIVVEPTGRLSELVADDALAGGPTRTVLASAFATPSLAR